MLIEENKVVGIVDIWWLIFLEGGEVWFIKLLEILLIFCLGCFCIGIVLLMRVLEIFGFFNIYYGWDFCEFDYL